MTQQAYNALNVEDTQLQGDVLSDTSELNQIRQELDNAKAYLSNVENQLSQARFALARLQGDQDAQDAYLMKIAQQELAQEQAAAVMSSAQNTYGSRSNPASFFQTAGNSLVNAERVVEQGARDAISAIQSVGRTVRNHVTKGIDAFSNVYPSPGPALVGLMFDEFNKDIETRGGNTYR